MEIISFYIVGKFAHFRTFYANTSDISHSIPPPTTIRGIIASILGIQKNQYHEDLGNSKLKIAINIDSEIKKSIFQQNFLKIDSGSAFRGAEGHTQIPIEIITPNNLLDDNIRYQIYLDVVEPDFRHQLFNKLKSRNYHFNISLGLANFAATIADVQLINTEVREAANEIIEFSSAVSTKAIKKICNVSDSDSLIESDILPIDFISNFSRAVGKTVEVVFCRNRKSLKVIFKGEYHKLLNSSNKNIQFIE